VICQLIIATKYLKNIKCRAATYLFWESEPGCVHRCVNSHYGHETFVDWNRDFDKAKKEFDEENDRIDAKELQDKRSARERAVQAER